MNVKMKIENALTEKFFDPIKCILSSDKMSGINQKHAFCYNYRNCCQQSHCVFQKIPNKNTKSWLNLLNESL